MALKIKLKHSAVNGKAPLPTDLDNGELALNTNAASPAAYIKDSAGNIVKLAGTGAIGGTDATTTAKGIVQLADAAAITAGTVGRVVDAAQLKAELATENTWDRTGTSLAPHTAGDVVNISAGTAALPGLTPVGDPNTGIYSPGADQVAVSTGGSERLRLDASGRLLVGTSSTRALGSITSQFLFEGTGFSTSPFFISNSNDQYGCFLTLGKSRGTSVGSNTVVQSSDFLGEISFVGADGSVLCQGAGIAAWVDGTPGANDMPGRLTFSTTASGAKTPTERMQINSSGNVLIGGTLPASPNISLKADGSAKFAGKVEAGNWDTSDAAALGAALLPGACYVKATGAGAPDSPAFQTTHGTKNTFRVLNSGTLMIGDLVSGSTNAPTVMLNTAGYVIAGDSSLSLTADWALVDGRAGGLGGFVTQKAAGVAASAFRASMAGADTFTAQYDGRTWIGGNQSANDPNIALNPSGTATFKGTVTATVTPPSDARFKENITPANPQLADVVALGKQLKNFDWNDKVPLNDELRAVRQLGLIAQEAEKVSPGIVKTIKRTKRGKELTPEKVIPAVYKDVVDPQDEENFLQELVTPEQIIPATYEEVDDSFKAISHDALIMKLLGAVAELSAEVEALKAAK